ncbi:phosphatase PAP2 family protein [Legionella maioricensis]|uniref:Phosphatase PAP2 family protein n=1 Tax=Legionella maioricensis TaxID=2896528 RepID=A0A9X2D352_9GAMM|nr:phosphatase PAP2 family protein [Legionella maioricensis]MCL9685588.1 phosphatase PAP2 family protein [Legionella maioricensis]MCL9688909.1 phosphatase PAP2 family protein [Legionella maioricensis]
MRTQILFSLPFLSGLILFLSIIALLVNYFIYQFPGNNFFPDDMTLLTIIIIITNMGLILLFGKNSRASNSGLEFFYFFIIMSVVAFATNAVQLTPFPTIDKKIISLEELLGINVSSIMIWTKEHSNLKTLLGIIYDSLPYQMSILPLIVIATGRFYLLKEYYFLLLITTLLGFSFYYFFPTSAPASIINSPYFSSAQMATGLKFYQIHHYIIPTTNEGGLIALPSFHTIWALLCVYLLKEWPIPCVLLLIINLLLMASCVLLGWHYVIDIIGAIILVATSYYLLTFYKATHSVVFVKGVKQTI